MRGLARQPVLGHAPGNATPLSPGDVRDLWLAMLRRGWKSLALVPASPAGVTLDLGRALCDLGAILRGRPVPLLSAVDLNLDSVSQFSDAMIRQAKKGAGGSDDDQRVIVVLDSIITNPLGMAVALAADAVLLVIELGESGIESARRTVELIGTDRFIGCVTIRRA